MKTNAFTLAEVKNIFPLPLRERFQLEKLTFPSPTAFFSRRGSDCRRGTSRTSTGEVRVRGKKFAFTLAEVLITLGIVGVVAVMTLPTVISNFKKHTVETRLKNQVALIQNAFRMAEAKHGSATEWDVCDDSFECTKSRFEKYLAPELKVIKICDHDNFEECWTAPSSLTGQKGYLQSDWDIALSAILYNGTSLYLWSGGNGNQMQIWFDIDGPNKGKALLGGDVFGGIIRMAYASIYSLPDPNSNDPNDAIFHCSKEVSTQYAGRYCGYEIQANSWKIPKDYPVRF